MKHIHLKNEKTLQADLSVIGAGGAGLSAAIAAAERGVDKIILLEARRVPGGNTVFAAGFFTVGSPAHKQEDIAKEVDMFFHKAMSYSHWRNNPRLVRTLIEKSVDIIPWLEAKGLKFEWDDSVLPLPPIYRILGSERGGAVVVKALAKRCEELGVQLLRQTRARKLLVDKSGRVAGVLAEKDGGRIRITTKCVIVATGGFAGNRELLREYFPDCHDEDNIHLGGLPHQGDGLLLAREIGAATDGLAFLEMSMFMFHGSAHLSLLAKEPDNVWVNGKGERFVNEAISPPEAANSIYRQPRKNFYALFDEKTKQIHFNRPLNPMDQMMLPKGSWPDQLDKDLKAYVDKDRVRMTDSWGEMAQWIGASPEDLKATIDEYNTCCDRGHDIFLKDKKYLLPLRNPPFYGIKCSINILVTHGDIKINHHMEVLDKQDNPIPGFYAIGDDIGGVDSDTYNMNLPGHSFGFAINSGRIAGEEAAKYVQGL